MDRFLAWLFSGTPPQWGTFASVLALLIVVIKFGPAWMQAMTDRGRARDASAGAAAESWRDIEARVSKELTECRHQREHDAQVIKRLDDENFRLRIVVSMTLDEFERIDPGSQIVLKAKAIMAVPAGSPDPEDVEQARLAELLARMPTLPRKRKRRAPRKI